MEIPNNHGWQCGDLKKWGHRAEPFHINLLNVCSNIQQWPKALPMDTASHQTAMSCRRAHRLWLTGSSDSTGAETVSDISGFQGSNCPLVRAAVSASSHGTGTGIGPTRGSPPAVAQPFAALSGAGQAEALLTPAPREQPGLSQVTPKDTCRFPAPSAPSNTPLIHAMSLTVPAQLSLHPDEKRRCVPNGSKVR